MKNYSSVGYQDVNITGGFWQNRQQINRDSTAQAVYDRFTETHRFSALECKWEEGMPNKPHVFWDSDVAKWIEGAAYLLMKQPNAKLEKQCDDAIAALIRNQKPDGYFNSHYLVCKDETRFTNRDHHELYCAGHWMEAACAYYQATGKREFLDAVCRYADLIYDVFYVQQSAPYATPGHPEIELALLRLYEVTGEKKYLDLGKFFLETRGNNAKDKPVKEGFNIFYAQDHKPLLEQDTAEGHCVRALYIYSAMADLARLTGDDRYFKTCQRLFADIIDRKMYITGGVGSSNMGESFTTEYFMPNDAAYTETCAAISLAMFCQRMLKLTNDSLYADVVERVLYNGMLSGVSLDGTYFNYTNPLEIDPFFANVNTATTAKRWRPRMERVAVFNCSCCPPNLLRLIASVGDYLYTTDEDTVYIHQYMDSEANVAGGKVIQKTAYPADGAICIRTENVTASRIALRIPGWCQNFRTNLPYTMENGYAIFENAGEICLELDMPVVLYEANTLVQENACRVAVTRGPVVYCLEEADNGKQLRSLILDAKAEFELEDDPTLGAPALRTAGLRRRWTEGLYRILQADAETVQIRFVPYYAFGNRGLGEMLTWVSVK